MSDARLAPRASQERRYLPPVPVTDNIFDKIFRRGAKHWNSSRLGLSSPKRGAVNYFIKMSAQHIAGQSGGLLAAWCSYSL